MEGSVSGINQSLKWNGKVDWFHEQRVVCEWRRKWINWWKQWNWWNQLMNGKAGMAHQAAKSCAASEWSNQQKQPINPSIQKRKNWWDWFELRWLRNGWLLFHCGWLWAGGPSPRNHSISTILELFPFQLSWLLFDCPSEDRPAYLFSLKIDSFVF